MLEALLGAIAVALVALLGLLVHRAHWVHHVIELAIRAYEYAEEEGILQGLAAYEKLEPFMRRFVETYRDKFGTEPKPNARAIAVKAMEYAVIEEHLGKSNR